MYEEIGMPCYYVRLVGVASVALLVGAAASAQVPGSVRDFGAQVAPMFEGWYQNPDDRQSY